MKKILLLVLGLAVVLIGCVRQPHEIYTISVEFDKRAAEEQLRPGNNTIIGSAMLWLPSGEVVTCAGQTVELIPATDYARERLSKLYRGEEKGYNPVMPDNELYRSTVSPASSEYVQTMVRTIANPQGFFTFEKIADGTYYVVTAIYWSAGQHNPQGGALMQRVHVSGGETRSIVLSH